MSYVQPALDLAQGEELRDQGIARVLGAESQAQWRQDAYHWLALLAYGQEVTSTDLIEAVGMPPSSNAVGAIMRSAAAQGLIESTGVYIKSPRPSCHAAVVRVWRST